MGTEPTYIIAIDFEAFGGDVNLNAFAEIGASLIDVNAGVEVDSFLMNVGIAHCANMEPRCMEEFWCENLKVLGALLTACSKSTSSPIACIDSFWSWVEAHVASGKHIDRIITDNCGFDGSLLATYTTGSALYRIDGTYRQITDVSDYYAGLLRAPLGDDNGVWKRLVAAENWVVPDFKVEHTHRANEDAKLMGLKYAFVQRMLRTNKA